MDSVDKDSLDSMRRQAAKISGLLLRPKSEIEELESSTSASQHETGLPQSQLVKDLTEVFKIFDKNGDGKISQAEVRFVLRALGEEPTASELHNMVKEVDADGDGYVDLEEFVYLNTMTLEATSGGDAGVTDAIKDAFHVFDLDNNGFISADELHKVLSGLGDEHLTLDDCRYMIKHVDRDGDEMVDFEEFQQMMSGGFVF